MAGQQDEFIPTRRSLITRLKNWDDQEGWKEFFDTYWKLLYSVAIKSGLSDGDAQDIVQETIVAVARRMPSFHYDSKIGSFKAWLLQITRRRIIDHLRKRARTPPRQERSPGDSDSTGTIERLPDPAARIDVIWEEEWQKNVFTAAVARVKSRIDARQFQIFDCYALKAWPVEEVAKNLNATVGQIYTAKSRVAALIKEEMERLEREMK